MRGAGGHGPEGSLKQRYQAGNELEHHAMHNMVLQRVVMVWWAMGRPAMGGTIIAPRISRTLARAGQGADLAVEEDVVQLDVAVGDAHAVAVVHGDHDLLEEQPRDVLRQRLALCQQWALDITAGTRVSCHRY